MSASPIPAEPAAPAVEPCAACASPLAADQRYCLQCGEVRRGARRSLPALLRDPRHRRETRDVVATTHGEDRWARLAAALAGVACLLLAMGVGVLIGRSGEGAPPPQAITIAAGAGAAAPAATQAAAFAGDWPAGKEGWTIALDELPKASTQPDAVAAAKAAATQKGAAAVGALDSDTYPSLTAGSYVVYSGVHDSRKVATAALASLKAKFADARVVQVSATGPASDPGPASSGGAAKGTSSKTKKPATAAQDTTKAFEESKKAPKTVGTGGKPPPKDNKPAAGGADFEAIE